MLNLKYTLKARVKNDSRKLIFPGFWEALVASHHMVKNQEGWPESILFGGVEVCEEKELNDFYKRLENYLKKTDLNSKTVQVFKRKCLNQLREKVIPQ